MPFSYFLISTSLPPTPRVGFPPPGRVQRLLVIFANHTPTQSEPPRSPSKGMVTEGSCTPRHPERIPFPDSMDLLLSGWIEAVFFAKCSVRRVKFCPTNSALNERISILPFLRERVYCDPVLTSSDKVAKGQKQPYKLILSFTLCSPAGGASISNTVPSFTKKNQGGVPTCRKLNH